MFLPSAYNQFPAYSFVYAIPYLLIAVFIFMLGYKWIVHNYPRPFPDKRLKIIMGVFVLFFGLRWHLFSDTIVYEGVFNGISTEWSLLDNVREYPFIDTGYMLFMLLFKGLGVNYAVFQFVNTLIDFSLLYICIKRYSINPAITCLFFLAFAGIQIECNLLRNVKALLIFLLSIKYIEEKKLIKYIICILFATTVHMSSILYLPMYWLINRKWNFKLILTISGVAVFIYFFASDLLSNLIDSLLGGIVGGEGKLMSLVMHSQSEKESLLSVGSIERLLFLILVLIMYRRIKEKEGHIVVFSNMYILYFFLFAIFGFNQVFRERIPILFISAYWFVSPYLLSRLKGVVPFVKTGLIVLAFLKVYASTNFAPAYYESVLFHNTTIEQREYFNEIMDK